MKTIFAIILFVSIGYLATAFAFNGFSVDRTILNFMGKV